ncbi:MAG: DUF4097 family beta strand repeat-containing protein [Ignavibacteriaceae bacterium]
MINTIYLMKQLATSLLFLSTITFAACNGMHISMDGDLQLIKEKTFSISYGKNLSVDISSGDVIVTSWDKAEVYVKIRGNENAMEKMDFTIEGNEEMVKVKGEKKSSVTSWFSNINVEIEIKVPAEFYVNVNTSGGDIKYGGVSGSAVLNTSGGDVWGEKFTGNLNISTSGGDISLMGGDTNINAETSGGDIKLDYKGENKGIDLSTSGGDIVIKLPEDFKASMQLSTSGGDVSCSLNMSNVKKSSGSKLVGDINGGGEKLTAHTSGGDITVTRR